MSGVVYVPEGSRYEIDWYAYRAEVAKEITIAIIQGGATQTDNENKPFRTIEEINRFAIYTADDLIKQLKGE